MAKVAEKALAKRQQTNVELFDPNDSAAGDVEQEDLAIPRLSILQSNSPQVAKRETTYVDGAEPGMIYDVVNGKLYDGETGVVLVPLNFRKTFIEWISREEGGGFVADHGLAGRDLVTTLNDKGQDILENGHQLVRTMEYVMYLLDEGGYQPCIVGMSSSQVKYSKRFNTQLNSMTVVGPNGERFPAPIYYKAWRFRTVPESNDRGSWFSWNIAAINPVTELELPWLEPSSFVAECKNFRAAVRDASVSFTPPPAPIEPEAEDDDSM